MKFNSIKIISLFVISIILVLGLSISFQSLLAAWLAPVSNPPVCISGDPGCDAPLNVGTSLQSKSGALKINANGASASGLIVEKGNVGIGTLNPGYKLSVVDTGVIPMVNIWNNGANQWTGIRFSRGGVADGNEKWFIGMSNADDVLRFRRTAGTDDMVIDANGNIGVGITNPAYKIDARGGQINSSGGFCINGDCITSWSQACGPIPCGGTECKYPGTLDSDGNCQGVTNKPDGTVCPLGTCSGGTCIGSCDPGVGGSCGDCGGTILCNGSCSISTPSNLGDSCTTDCIATGIINCSGECEGSSFQPKCTPCGGGGNFCDNNGNCIYMSECNIWD
jgi:hypothetical protein